MSKSTDIDKAAANAQLAQVPAMQTALQRFYTTHKKHIASVIANGREDELLSAMYSLLARTPALMECTPVSLLNSVVLASQLGLRFGTPEVSMVKFGQEATLIIGYQGKVKLALAGRVITRVEAELVYECDVFEYWRDQDGLHFKHKPEFAARRVVGAATDKNLMGAYCQLGTVGGSQTRFVDLGEILDARSRSRGYAYQVKKNGTDNPWFTAFGAMALKTAVHRAMKLAPQDANLSIANSIDDEEEGGASVIAPGLNLAEFAPQELGEPLVSTKAEHSKLMADAGAVDLAEFPDVMDHPAGTRIRAKGKWYVSNEDRTAWRAE